MYKINLLPRDLQDRPNISFSRLIKISLIALLICTAAASYAGFLYHFKVKQEELEGLKMELASMVPAVGKLNNARKNNIEQEKVLMQLEKLLQSNINWYELLEDINYSVPQDISLAKIQLARVEIYQQPQGVETGENKQQGSVIDSLIGYGREQNKIADESRNNKTDRKVLIIEGAGTSLSTVGLFIYKLQQLPYFDKVTLKSARQEENKKVLMLFSIYAFLPEEKSSE